MSKVSTPMHADRDALPHAAATPVWRWIVVGQLWMLTAFVGMSLLVIATLSSLHGGAGHALDGLLLTGFGGALLMALAWYGLTRMLQRLEGEDRHGPGPGLRQRPGRRGRVARPATAARMTTQTA